MEDSRKPLAEIMRPKTLDDVVGQDKILPLLKKIVAKNEPISMIFWGPPGTGKTTLARIIARESKADFIELSAVIAKKADVESAIEHARQNWNLKVRTVLFVDEIHRFNKAQQDAFLPHVESGLITLIGATTENPSFEVISPLISRSRVMVIDQLSRTDLEKILARALDETKFAKKIDDEAKQTLITLAHGDARSLLGNLEMAISLNPRKISRKIVEEAAGKKLPNYDKKGDAHYDIISAFIKSMRGSEPEATQYYLARMLAAGEDPKFIARRMIVFASEDIGLAGNGAISLANAAFDAVEKVGLPEAKFALFHAATALARSAKSREITEQMYAAQKLVEQFPDAKIPLYIRNAPTNLMKNLDYAKDYEWKTGFNIGKNYLPDEIAKFKQKK